MQLKTTLLNQHYDIIHTKKLREKFGVEIKENKERKIFRESQEMATKQKSCRWCKSVKEGR
jgi:hypothetical protein